VGVSGSTDDFREFTSQLILRFERSMGELVRELRQEREVTLTELRDMRAEGRAFQGESRVFWAETRKFWEEMRDLREESRMHRQALLQILDRLDDGGSAPAG
jgi:hypothetical protein